MIWIIGSKGMLGKELVKNCKTKNIAHCQSDIDVDILSMDSLENFYQANRPDIIINCAAYTNVDKAEDEKEKAMALNCSGVENIAFISKKYNLLLIHISTDYVFSGTEKTPLDENMPTDPKTVYGETKLAGEQRITELLEKYFIIRTSWLYGLHGNNFVFTMLKLMESNDVLNVVDDQIGSPTSAISLSETILNLIDDAKDFGIYHYSNLGEISWNSFAIEIYNLAVKHKLLSKECKIQKCDSSQFPTRALRPKYSVLSKKKISRFKNIKLYDWKDQLDLFIQSIDGELK